MDTAHNISSMAIILTLFFLLCISTSAPSNNLLSDAVTALSHTGFNSMSHALESGSGSIITPPFPDSLTIFAPSDKAFPNFYDPNFQIEPSLNLLRFHCSPIYFSLRSINSSKIPTLWANHSSLVSFDGVSVLVNGVRINGSPLYDDGSLVIYGIDNFFDPNYQVIDDFSPTPSVQVIEDLSICSVLDASNRGPTAFDEARSALILEGYNLMASFLDLQLPAFNLNLKLTIFAPPDESLRNLVGGMISEGKLFKSHIIPCMTSIDYLVDADESNDLIDAYQSGLTFSTLLEGFFLQVTSDGVSKVTLNGRVNIVAPAVYTNTWLIIHGLDGCLVDNSTMDLSTPPPSQPIPTQTQTVSHNYLLILASLVVALLILLFALYLGLIDMHQTRGQDEVPYRGRVEVPFRGRDEDSYFSKGSLGRNEEDV